MSYFQVVRVKGFTKGSLRNILNETDRTDGEFKNIDRQEELAFLNHSYKDIQKAGIHATYNSILKECNCKPFVDKKNAIAFEGVIITASREFFENELGWVAGKPAPPAVKEYFDKAYELAIEKFGFQGTDKNFLTAKIHYDENAPHLQIDYIPIVENYKGKVYQTDEEGKICRNEKGSPIQLKDENGKTVFKEVKGVPKVSKSDFWRERGGKNSYSLLQDFFYEKLAKEYGLERGEKGSNAKHKTNHQYHAEQEEALNKTTNIKRNFGETQQAYEDRVATERKAVAIQQKEKELKKREALINAKETRAEMKEEEAKKTLDYANDKLNEANKIKANAVVSIEQEVQRRTSKGNALQRIQKENNIYSHKSRSWEKDIETATNKGKAEQEHIQNVLQKAKYKGVIER